MGGTADFAKPRRSAAAIVRTMSRCRLLATISFVLWLITVPLLPDAGLYPGGASKPNGVSFWRTA
jgi:hypothetical protein